MNVKITLEYKKTVGLPDKELWQVYRHSQWVAGVVEALERLDYTHVHVMVEKVDEEENENTRSNS